MTALITLAPTASGTCCVCFGLSFAGVGWAGSSGSGSGKGGGEVEPYVDLSKILYVDEQGQMWDICCECFDTEEMTVLWLKYLGGDKK